MHSMRPVCSMARLLQQQQKNLYKIRGNFQVLGNILGKFCSLNLATLLIVT